VCGWAEAGPSPAGIAGSVPAACDADEIRNNAAMSHPVRTFSEREFYLEEFHGRTIGIAWPAEEQPESEPLASVIDELVNNESQVVLLSPQDAMLAIAGGGPPVDLDEENAGPRLWRRLRENGSAGMRISADRFEADCERAVLMLRLSKLVWIQSTPPIERIEGSGRISVVDLAHLEPLLAPEGGAAASDLALRVMPGRRSVLETIRRMIEGGVSAVNVCAAPDLALELFTYAGAGIFFTRNRYAEVRRLAIDDYDPAHDLIARGEADGFLVPRGPEARDAILAHGVGVFIEGQYLAGVGALLPYEQDRAMEVASLFALTRYIGEGAGGHIVRYAIDHARQQGLRYVFGCTTSERVKAFFENHGFRNVGPDEVPKQKWDDYDPERRARLHCLRFDL
jgi:N-acetylglutamate synthase-like GNAT family acetyltransferase